MGVKRGSWCHSSRSPAGLPCSPSSLLAHLVLIFQEYWGPTPLTLLVALDFPTPSTRRGTLGESGDWQTPSEGEDGCFHPSPGQVLLVLTEWLLQGNILPSSMQSRLLIYRMGAVRARWDSWSEISIFSTVVYTQSWTIYS